METVGANIGPASLSTLEVSTREGATCIGAHLWTRGTCELESSLSFETFVRRLEKESGGAQSTALYRSLWEEFNSPLNALLSEEARFADAKAQLRLAGEEAPTESGEVWSSQPVLDGTRFVRHEAGSKENELSPHVLQATID